jgi:hypothetical protein
MTLAPIENRRVRGVEATRYPLNPQCSHPECSEAAQDPHHIFRRRLIGNDSWFVEITEDDGGGEFDPEIQGGVRVLPHVTGLCRKHHDEVTEHLSWIKLEDGEFVWYGRANEPPASEDYRPLDAIDAAWSMVGPLSPQPGGRDTPPRRRKKFEGEKRRKRKTISLRVPDDTEDGGAIWDELLDDVKTRLIEEGLYSEGDKIPNYEALVAALRDWLSGWIRNG